MMAAADAGVHAVTDGEIALVNLEGSRRRSWDRLAADPMRTGAAERVVEEEQLTLQFTADAAALDRLELLANALGRLDAASARTALVQAQVASATHRFAAARQHLAQAEAAHAAPQAVERMRLAIDQACGERLGAVLDARRRRAQRSNGLEDLVPLGALLVDLREFDAAQDAYLRALKVYQDVSPFAVAWVCFQLGMLWGEQVPEPQPQRAAAWYSQALQCVPRYVKARVHLAELHLRRNEAEEAEALLDPALASADPEVPWRLADALAAQGRFGEAEAHLALARAGYERLVQRHRLAFADHAAEFYAAGGNDLSKALALARANVENRPTLRAFEQAHAIAVDAGDAAAAAEWAAATARRYGATHAFRRSSLAGRAGSIANGDGA